MFLDLPRVALYAADLAPRIEAIERAAAAFRRRTNDNRCAQLGFACRALSGTIEKWAKRGLRLRDLGYVDEWRDGLEAFRPLAALLFELQPRPHSAEWLLREEALRLESLWELGLREAPSC